ncbi:hypothetical protein FHL15_007856 [Xylaria flabelliformis]|uniref:Uncharacterized protein n=1 Tax=Xylaria flabelliformis TaxID=2512241 RepID=A0A553HTJ1_9PEZI|nr:hypothetical protein FHL15_007856 [Xylaria flabelliformis]
MSGTRQVPFLTPVSSPTILIDSQPSSSSPHTCSNVSSSVPSFSCRFHILTFDVESYKLQDIGQDNFRVAAAVEEGRPASSGRSRMTEPGGRELAWIKATFVVAVLTFTIAVVGLGIRVWQISKQLNGHLEGRSEGRELGGAKGQLVTITIISSTE